MRYAFVLLLFPFLSRAGVLYNVAVRPVDQSSIEAIGSAGPPATTAAVTEYFVEGGKVRIGGLKASYIYVFKDRIMYVVDNASRTVHVLRRATLSQVTAHYADAVRELQTAAANAPPEERANAQRRADDMKEVSDRMRQPVARDFKVTVRFESVDGHACRIWEEREKDAKRFELCVAPAATIPGGVEILSGVKTLSQFREGSNFAFGVDFGLSDWWQDIDLLGGLPILIREFKYDSQISETVLSGMRQGVLSPAPFDLPVGFQVIEGPDYQQWYVR